MCIIILRYDLFHRFVHVGYIPLAYEYLSDSTAPLSSLQVSSCLLTISSQICAVVFTLIHNVIIDAGGHLAANLTMFGFLVIGCVLTALIKSPQQRSHVNESSLKIEEITGL